VVISSDLGCGRDRRRAGLDDVRVVERFSAGGRYAKAGVGADVGRAWSTGAVNTGPSWRTGRRRSSVPPRELNVGPVRYSRTATATTMARERLERYLLAIARGLTISVS